MSERTSTIASAMARAVALVAVMSSSCATSAPLAANDATCAAALEDMWARRYVLQQAFGYSSRIATALPESNYGRQLTDNYLLYDLGPHTTADGGLDVASAIDGLRPELAHAERVERYLPMGHDLALLVPPATRVDLLRAVMQEIPVAWNVFLLVQRPDSLTPSPPEAVSEDVAAFTAQDLGPDQLIQNEAELATYDGLLKRSAGASCHGLTEIVDRLSATAYSRPELSGSVWRALVQIGECQCRGVALADFERLTTLWWGHWPNPVLGAIALRGRDASAAVFQTSQSTTVAALVDEMSSSLQRACAQATNDTAHRQSPCPLPK